MIAVGIAGGLRVASPQRTRPPQAVTKAPRSETVRPPGDDVVVFWVDDETPVFVDLSK
jgi:hypothetical protein